MILELDFQWLIGTALTVLGGFVIILRMFFAHYAKTENEKLSEIRGELREMKKELNTNMTEVRTDYLTRREYETHRKEVMRYLRAILQNVRGYPKGDD